MVVVPRSGQRTRFGKMRILERISGGLYQDSPTGHIYNGLLLSALWDAAFDRGLISFTDGGADLFDGRPCDAARAALAITLATRLFGLRDQRRMNLASHRSRNCY